MVLCVFLAFMVIWKFSVLQKERKRVMCAQKKSGFSAQALGCLGASGKTIF